MPVLLSLKGDFQSMIKQNPSKIFNRLTIVADTLVQRHVQFIQDTAHPERCRASSLPERTE